MEGVAWKVGFLLAVLAATLAFAVPRLLRRTEYLRFAEANTTIDFLSVPAAVLVAFYLAGWQAALILGVVALAVSHFLTRLIVDRQFADVPRNPLHNRRSLRRDIAAGAILLVAVSGIREYLRFLPWLSVPLAVAAAFSNEIAGNRGFKALDGKGLWAFRIGMIFAASAFVLASELVWRFGTFEAWMWLVVCHKLAVSAFTVPFVSTLAAWFSDGSSAPPAS